MGLLESLPVQRVRPVLFLPFFSGSVSDVSGYSNNPVESGDVAWKTIGGVDHLSFSGNGLLTVADSSELRVSNITACVFGDFDKFDVNGDGIIRKRDVSGVDFDWTFGSTTLSNLRVDGTVSGMSVDWVGAKFLAVSLASGGNKPKIYKDGAFIAEGSSSLTTIGDDAPIIVGNYYDGSTPIASAIKAVLIYDEVLTASEISQIYSWGKEQSYVKIKPKKYLDIDYNKVPETALGYWDLGKMYNGVVVDESGNGNDAAVEGQNQFVKTQSGDICRSLTSTSNFKILNSDSLDQEGAMTIAAYLKVDTTGAIFDRGTTTPFIGMSAGKFLWGYSGAYTATNDTFDDGIWHRLVCTYDGGSSFSSLKVYVDGFLQQTTDSTGPFNGFTSNNAALRFLSRFSGVSGMIGGVKSILWDGKEWTEEEIVQDAKLYNKGTVYHNSFDNLKKEFSYLTSGKIDDYDILTGTWDMLGGQYTKGIICQTSGLISRPQPEPYGEYNIKVKVVGSSFVWLPIASFNGSFFSASQNGFMMSISATQKISLSRVTAGSFSTLFETADSFITQGYDYEFKLIRNSFNHFFLKIRGGSYTEWEDVGNAFDDTATTAAYSLLGLSANDRLYEDIQKVGNVNDPYVDNDEPLVFILAGQSNMDGRGPVGDLSDIYTEIPSGVEVWEAGARQTVFNSGTWFGPDTTFAHYAVRAYPGRRIIIIKRSAGGTCAYASWQKVWDPVKAAETGSSTHMYPLLIGDITDIIVPRGLNITGMVWFQGEQDATSAIAGSAYATSIGSMMSDLNTDLAASGGIPEFILARIYWTGGAGSTSVRSAQDGFPASPPDSVPSTVIDIDDLSDNGDGVHLDAASLETVGIRFAAEI